MPATATRPHGFGPLPRLATTDVGLPRQAGIGLKTSHITALLSGTPSVGFVEVHAENYMVDGGPLHHYLTQVRQRYPMSLHGVGLSIGGASPLSRTHLDALVALTDRYQPTEFSEHLAWSSHGGQFLNDLLPIAYDHRSLERVCDHIDELQEILRRSVLIENPATYVEFAESSFSEEDFIGEIVRRTGCGLLLDVNNAYVTCTNHGRDAHIYLAALPLGAVRQIHLAGFHREVDSMGFPLLIDHHGSPVDEVVWSLYQWLTQRCGALPTLIEWDNDVPSLDRLVQESAHAQRILDQYATTAGSLHAEL